MSRLRGIVGAHMQDIGGAILNRNPFSKEAMAGYKSSSTNYAANSKHSASQFQTNRRKENDS